MRLNEFKDKSKIEYFLSKVVFCDELNKTLELGVVHNVDVTREEGINDFVTTDVN